ncbi:Alpha/beta hydrolase fold [Parasponia andersonii]|uniref:Alpha/beta hydrolase fold n=1 Tax=Parasponia andersonii TaxID=3476 RepID=A0A2P5D750_PARAD|nr:Alpha/beta hydrolase fold [Parasponia andersonii]
MHQTSKEVAIDFDGFRIYKDGTIDRFDGDPTVPPSESKTGVRSKDVVISSGSGISARVFLPKISDPTQKIPLLVYYHGGAFCVCSAFSPGYTRYASSLAQEANVVVLAVNYRRAPMDPLPTAFEDAWEALQWAAAHSGGSGPEAWINQFADLERAFVGGDSAGGTLAQNVVLRAGVDGLGGKARLVGMALFDPFFGNDEPDKLMEVIFPSYSGANDRTVNPAYDPNLGRVGCERVLVFVAEKDSLRDRGWGYYEALKKSGWSGVADIVDTEGEEHVFHLENPESEKAKARMRRTVSFLNQAHI